MKEKIEFKTFKNRLIGSDISYKYMEKSDMRKLYEDGHPLAFDEVEDEELFFFVGADEKKGPYVRSQIKSMWSSGSITADCSVESQMNGKKSSVQDFLQNESASPSTKKKESNTEDPIEGADGVRVLSLLLLIGGLAVAGYFFAAFDTSVSTKIEYIPGYGSVGGQRVENIGLLNQRQNGITIGIGVALVGTILLVARNVRKNNKS